MDINNRAEWVRCPVCGNKTRLQIRADTELKNFPLYCPKCKQESLIDAKNLQVTVLKKYSENAKLINSATNRNLEEEVIMSRLEVNIEYIEQQTIYGLWKKSNDRTISKDINALSKQYYAVVSMPEGNVLPYFVLSRNYNKKSHDFELFIGSVIDKCGLESCVLSANEYAKITVKPKLGFMWGASIGEAKRYFYGKWLLENPYEALNMEYEYHTEKAIRKHPVIDIIFAIKKTL